MGTKSWIAAACAATALLGTPAQALDAQVYVQIAPPAPRYEVVPVARHGYTWVPGHWEWRRRQHVWVPGHHVAVRPGYYYAQPAWVQYGDRWGYHAGGWRHGHPPAHGRRDRDRDGIPDRYDRDLDNDGRPNRYDRDRDGDGVPNHRDRRPDNRNRY